MSEHLITPGLPIAGLYKMKLVKGGPWVTVEIWYGPPHDPATGEIMDRSFRWQARVDGGDAEDPLRRAWPYCSGQPLTDSEFRYMRDTAKWAKDFAPDQPEAKPRDKIDLNRLSPLF